MLIRYGHDLAGGYVCFCEGSTFSATRPSQNTAVVRETLSLSAGVAYWVTRRQRLGMGHKWPDHD